MTSSTLDVLNLAYALEDFQFNDGNGNNCNIQLKNINTVINNVVAVNGREDVTFDINYRNVDVDCEFVQGQVNVDSILTFSSLDFDELIPFNTVTDIACEDLKVFQTSNEVSIEDFGVDLITVCENIENELNIFIQTIENKDLFQLASNRLPQFNNAIEDLENKIANANENQFQFAINNDGEIEQTIEKLVEELFKAPVLIPIVEAIEDQDIATLIDLVNALFDEINSQLPSNARTLQQTNAALEELLEILGLHIEELAALLDLEVALAIALFDTTFQVLLQNDPVFVNFIDAFGADTTLAEFFVNVLNLDLDNLDFDLLLEIFNPLGINIALFLPLFDQFEDLFDILFGDNLPIIADFANDFIEVFEVEFRQTLGNVQVQRNNNLPNNLQLFLQALAKAVKELDFLADIAPLPLNEISEFLGLDQQFVFDDGSSLNLVLSFLNIQGRFRDENVNREDLDVIFNVPTVILDPSVLILEFDTEFRNADNVIIRTGKMVYRLDISILPDLAGALAFDFNILNQVSFFRAVDEETLLTVIEEIVTCFLASTAIQFGQVTLVDVKSAFAVDNNDLQTIFNGTTQVFIELVPTIIENFAVELTQNFIPLLDDDQGTCADNIFVENNAGLIAGAVVGSFLLAVGVVGFMGTCGVFSKRKTDQRNIMQYQN